MAQLGGVLAVEGPAGLRMAGSPSCSHSHQSNYFLKGTPMRSTGTSRCRSSARSSAFRLLTVSSHSRGRTRDCITIIYRRICAFGIEHLVHFLGGEAMICLRAEPACDIHPTAAPSSDCDTYNCDIISGIFDQMGGRFDVWSAGSMSRASIVSPSCALLRVLIIIPGSQNVYIDKYNLMHFHIWVACVLKNA